MAQAMPAHGGKVHRRGQAHQLLVGADVGGGPLPPDVLLPRLQGEDVAGAAVHVGGAADDAARHLAQVPLAAGEEPQEGPAEAWRPAQALPLGDGDVSGVVARRRQQAQGDEVDHGDEEGTGRVGGPFVGPDVLQMPEKVGVLDRQAGVLLGRAAVGDGVHRQAAAAGVGAHHVGVRRVNAV